MKTIIKCIDCRFLREDAASSSMHWKALECGNFDGEYYKSLLNVSSDGDKRNHITYSGCEDGELKQSGLVDVKP